MSAYFSPIELSGMNKFTLFKIVYSKSEDKFYAEMIYSGNENESKSPKRRRLLKNNTVYEAEAKHIIMFHPFVRKYLLFKEKTYTISPTANRNGFLRLLERKTEARGGLNLFFSGCGTGDIEDWVARFEKEEY